MENSPNQRIIGRLTLSFDEIDSTNDLALRWLAKSKPIEGTVITAAFQHHGKGQIGRKWEGGRGNNLAYSAILYPGSLEAGRTFYVLMALSTGVHRAVTVATGLEGLRLKWPNDLYFHDRKLAGMLIQTALAGSRVQHVVFGVGVNVNEADFPSDLVNPVSVYQATGRRLSISELTLAVHDGLETAYSRVLAADWEGIHRDYEALLYGKGEVRAFLNLKEGRSFEAMVCGVEPNGKLCLQEDGERRFFQMHEIRWL